MKNATSRRRFVKQTAAGVGLFSLPALLSAKTTAPEKLKIVCVGGHPDDPESGCGGTLQTMVFKPTDYVDISDTKELKKKAVYAHVSQDPPGIYQCGHAAMEEFRGRELGVPAPEAFVRMTGRKNGNHFIF